MEADSFMNGLIFQKLLEEGGGWGQPFPIMSVDKSPRAAESSAQTEQTPEDESEAEAKKAAETAKKIAAL